MNTFQSRRGAFSLIEILVVLGIAALMAAMALGGFSSFQGSQRRSTCQGNMVQIYRAARLYANDNDAFPPVYAASPGQLSGGLGLLWGQRDTTSGGTGLKPPSFALSYLRDSSALHCPADVGKDTAQTAVNAQGQVALSYMSYQKVDSQGGDDTDTNVPGLSKNQSYSPIRTITSTDKDFSRQLFHQTSTSLVNIPVPSDSVVTWCPFHRGLSSKPDDVLFYDGSVRRMVITQDAGCQPGRPASSGWRRVANCDSSPVNNEGAKLAQP